MVLKMVNKKTSKDYCRACRLKKGDPYKANDAVRKKLQEKEKNI